MFCRSVISLGECRQEGCDPTWPLWYRPNYLVVTSGLLSFGQVPLALNIASLNQNLVARRRNVATLFLRLSFLVPWTCLLVHI
ncbi:hypothetical protein MCOR14_008351, partial [Pyricularia oryzae]